MKNKALQKIGKLISDNQEKIPVLGSLTPVSDSVMQSESYYYTLKIAHDDTVSFVNTEERLGFFEEALLDGKRPAILAMKLDEDQHKTSFYFTESLYANDIDLNRMKHLATVALTQLDVEDIKEAMTQEEHPAITHKFAYYAGKLLVSKTKDYGQLVEKIAETLDLEPSQLEMADIAVGDILDNGMNAQHKNIVNSNTQSDANKAIKNWFSLKKSKKEKPDYQFVYYNGALKVVEYDHNNRFKRAFEDLLKENGYDRPITLQQDFDPSQTAGGNIYIENGNPIIEHRQLADAEVQEKAAKAINDYFENEIEKHNLGEWSTLNPSSENVDPWLMF
jgi:hypothetical protein